MSPPRGRRVNRIAQMARMAAKEDAEELAVLTRFLREERGARTIALAGHSTGCQDAVAYVRDRGQHGGVPLAAGALRPRGWARGAAAGPAVAACGWVGESGV